MCIRDRVRDTNCSLLARLKTRFYDDATFHPKFLILCFCKDKYSMFVQQLRIKPMQIFSFIERVLISLHMKPTNAGYSGREENLISK